jgi:hypothetical protein
MAEVEGSGTVAIEMASTATLMSHRNMLKCQTLVLSYLRLWNHDTRKWNQIMLGDRHEANRT